jgi:DNA-binding transcriptional MerR regulator/methylmalonyl-CoA mutase cobalamin-binding subunit
MTNTDDDRMITISEVERETGIAKETLRVWERRYAFPRPDRDANGERIYTREQRIRLQLIKRLIDKGYRPGKIVNLSGDELNALAQLAARASATPPPDASDPLLAECMAMIGAHRVYELRQVMMQAQLRLGLRGFVTDLVAPLTTLVGDAWAAGRLAIFEEHLYAETLQGVMRAAIFTASQQNDRELASPRILLTTVPMERHGLGLLMAEALFALEGACCISLGVQTPLSEIVSAAQVHRADVVALSFSSAISSRAAIDNITQLKERLDGTAEVWVGGACAAQLMRQLGPECVLDLEGIAAAVQRWRTSHVELAN